MRGWLKRAALIAGINAALTLLLLYGLEGVLALTAPDLPPNGPVDGRLYTWGHEVVENSRGFREREFAVPKPAGTFRVMVLGDSLTWGTGLAREERYTDLLEERLAGAVGTGRVEVLNFGLIGGPTSLERNILLEHVEDVDPDLIVVGFCLNDTQPRPQNDSPERRLFTARHGGRIKAVTRPLRGLGMRRVSSLVNDGIFRLAELAGAVPHWHQALQRTYEPDSSEWQAFEQALSDIRRVADERGLPPPIFAVLNQGTSTTAPTDYAHPDDELKRFLRWYRQAESAARAAGFMAYNHEQEIATELAHRSLAINVVDGHPSAELNRLYARKLEEIMRPVLVYTPASRPEKDSHEDARSDSRGVRKTSVGGGDRHRPAASR